MKAAIIGATGYGGAELVRFLQQHKYVESYTLHSSKQGGQMYSSSYPQFNEIIDQPLVDVNIDQIIEIADVVFMATPSGISSKITPQLIKEGVKVIDLSGDFRFKDREIYEKWYKNSTASQKDLSEAVYGLTELNRKNIKNARLIANPGCYPTATILGLYPLVKSMQIEAETIIVDAKSGVSGAGRKESLGTSFCEVNDNFRIYKVNQHQHIPEIQQALDEVNPSIGAIKFSTHLVPMTRGIMATIYCKPTETTTEKQLRDLYKQFYQHDSFVRIRKEGEYPATKEVYGSNYCDIGLTYDERTGWITIVSVIDNLVKGAAGQAIQNMNVMIGVNENTSLLGTPIFP